MGKIAFYKKDKFKRGTAHIVYDLSIECIEKRKSQAITFDSANQCAKYLGVTTDVLKTYVSVKAQKRLYSDKLKKTFAIRIAKAN